MKFLSANQSESEHGMVHSKTGSGFAMPAGMQKSLMQEMQEKHKRKAGLANQAASTS
jgi:hypothetical protein